MKGSDIALEIAQNLNLEHKLVISKTLSSVTKH